MKAFAESLASSLFPVFLTMMSLSVSPVVAQSGNVGSIHITVVDPTDAAIPDASLELRDLGTNETRIAVSQANGAYTFPNLPFGLYQLTITAKGFQREVYQSVQVQTARATEVRSALQVGATTETVQVDAGATPLVEPTSTTLATTIDTKQVLDLPIQGRNV